MFNRATIGKGAPRYLSSDHDPLYRYHQWRANLRIREVQPVKTAPVLRKKWILSGLNDLRRSRYWARAWQNLRHGHRPGLISSSHRSLFIPFPPNA
jgi:hypothetical protein